MSYTTHPFLAGGLSPGWGYSQRIVSIADDRAFLKWETTCELVLVSICLCYSFICVVYKWRNIRLLFIKIYLSSLLPWKGRKGCSRETDKRRTTIIDTALGTGIQSFNSFASLPGAVGPGWRLLTGCFLSLTESMTESVPCLHRCNILFTVCAGQYVTFAYVCESIMYLFILINPFYILWNFFVKHFSIEGVIVKISNKVSQ